MFAEFGNDLFMKSTNYELALILTMAYVNLSASNTDIVVKVKGEIRSGSVVLVEFHTQVFHLVT